MGKRLTGSKGGDHETTEEIIMAGFGTRRSLPGKIIAEFGMKAGATF
jgi:hypothetical protein